MRPVDIAVIGAGPAGMSAAASAARLGLGVLLLDEQPTAGGQVYRAVETASESRGAILGKDYLRGLELTEKIKAATIDHIAGATLWRIDGDGTLTYSVSGRAHQAMAGRIILATGALERPVPIPGWTMPGVMTAGAGQILLKQSGMVAQRAVIAGCGPLLYLLAAQMIAAGWPPLALVETQRRSDTIRALPHLPAALANWRMLAKGAALLAQIRKAGVQRYCGASQLRVEGANEVEALAFHHGGTTQRIVCSTVMLHQGVVPNVQAAQSLRIAHRWDGRQRAFRPVINDWGKTSNSNVYIAGDGAGIAGADAAELTGRLAALDAAASLGAIGERERDRRAAPLRRRLARELAVRPFLDTAYPPSPEILNPADATIVCRCEEVTAGDIRRYAAAGCRGPNQTKAFGRCGMGPCQGRYCGLSVTEILAEENRLTHEETGYFRIRAPLKPVTLGELATLAEG